MREYRWKYRLYSFVVPQSWYVLFHARRGARREVFRVCGAWVFRDVSARIALYPSRLKDEPRQGFLSVQLFERERPLFGYCFSSGDEGLFCDTIFPKKPLCPIARKRRAMTGFIRVPFFKKKAIVIVCFMTCHDGVLRYLKLLPSGAKRHLSKSCRYRNRKFILRLLAYNFLMSGRESVFNSRHHNRMANHHRAMQSC